MLYCVQSNLECQQITMRQQPQLNGFHGSSLQSDLCRQTDKGQLVSFDGLVDFLNCKICAVLKSKGPPQTCLLLTPSIRMMTLVPLLCEHE